MRALSSPNALKGVLTAQAAAAALARGLRSAGVEAEELPVADGGDGTADVLAGVLGGEWYTARVSDPLGRPVDARWLLLPERVAVVESAEAIGLKLLAEGELDPLRASSRGFGELILAALSGGAAELILCLGGVATVDGGAGLREVVDSFPVPTRVARDVVAPLLGPRGAAYAYGPQKGATRDQVVELEERLAAMPDLEPYASSTAASSCSTRSTSTRGSATSTSSSPARARSTRPPPRARPRRPWCGRADAPACAASPSAAESSSSSTACRPMRSAGAPRLPRRISSRSARR